VWLTPDYIHEPLYVVTAIYNPIRFKSRWKRYERFAAHVKASGGILVTVEASFGERHHALSEGTDHRHISIPQRALGSEIDLTDDFRLTRTTHPHQYIQVQTKDELWIKENLINIGISRLPHDWKYVAWVDADVMFARPNWVGETIHQLQHYKIVQMFSEAQDVGPRYASISTARGFMHCYIKGVPRPRNPQKTGGYYYGVGGAGKSSPILWHPGFAWAARREAINELGGLVDFGMMGAADNHMAHALIGKVDESYHPDVHPRYKGRLLEWQNRAERYIRRNVGYVSGLLIHYWHGRKVDRRYWDRWKVIVENKFNPDVDLKYDWQGLNQLVDRGTARSLKLRDDARKHYRSRNEDSIELSGIADVE
jgi:hypothetical protein